MRRIVPSLIAAALAFSCSKKAPPSGPDGDNISPPKSSGEFDIPFERFTLDNGLTVLLHQDKSDPIVAIATVVHVGSAREKKGRTGFAHFFEHMSFNNSENVPMGANRKMIPELGGTRNGGTWNDWTIYYEVVPKDAFAKLLWIDSDRLGYMINTVKEATLEREKQVVKNEKRQRVDNRAYGHTNHVIRKALYPEGHPYSWTVIGDLEDLQAATLDDVREFYDRYYVPANATLVVAGDIELEETKREIQKWFGEIKAGKPVADLEPTPIKLAEEKRLYHLDSFAKVAELRMTFPTVEETHPDRIPLDMLGSILADGKSAPLYKTIVADAKLSSSVSAYHTPSELTGVFTIQVRANPGVDLDPVATKISEALAGFETNGFRDTDLARIKARSETDFYAGLESILDRALSLGLYEEFYGDAAKILETPKQVAAVTRADIERVYATYIKGKAAVITSFVPKATPELILEGSKEADVVIEKVVAGAEKQFKETDNDDFERTPTKHDRSEPPLGPRPIVKAPKISRDERGGVPIVGITHDELPMVSFHLRIDGGQQLDPPTKIGIANLVAELLPEGTETLTPEEMQDRIELLGASVNVSASRTAINITGTVLRKNYAQLMALVSDMILAPRWDAAEFERVKTAQLARLEQQEGNPVSVARTAFGLQLFGPGHPAGEPFGGTSESVESITLSDLRTWYAGNVSSRQAVFHFAGALSTDEARASLTELDRKWAPRTVDFPRPQPATPPKASRLFFIDFPDAKQSVIITGMPGPQGDDPAFYRSTVAVNRLGSGTSARLAQKLRIEKGYSYGAWAGFSRSRIGGAFTATSQVRSNVTLESLEIFQDLIGNYRKTFTAEDLATTQNLIAKGDTRRFESQRQLLRVVETMTRFGLPDDYIEQQSKELAGLTLADVHAELDARIRPGELIYVVVGDAKTQLANVEKFGLGKPVLLDRRGDRISNQ